MVPTRRTPRRVGRLGRQSIQIDGLPRRAGKHQSVLRDCLTTCDTDNLLGDGFPSCALLSESPSHYPIAAVAATIVANYLDNLCKVDVRFRSIFRAKELTNRENQEPPSMLTLKKSLSTLLVLALSVAPVLAESNEAKAANPPEANSNNAEAASAPASPSLTSSATDANVMALLGLLVMKGVLAPNEANAIRNAAPTTQFQALVEALKRKGVVSAADLSAISKPAAPPSAAPSPAGGTPTTEAVSTSSTVSTMEVASASGTVSTTEIAS